MNQFIEKIYLQLKNADHEEKLVHISRNVSYPRGSTVTYTGYIISLKNKSVYLYNEEYDKNDKSVGLINKIDLDEILSVELT